MSERVRWGILATGGIAANFTDDLRVAGLHVAAVGSRTQDRAEAFAREHARRGRNAPRACWAAQGDPCRGPDLWHELASLRNEPGAREPGPWLERRLEREVERARRELERRLARMRRAVDGRAPSLPGA
jgi:hypothetical protein